MPGKVLIIARPFPPCGGSGVQRTLKFVKYLPYFGWQPIVLTAKKPLLPEIMDNSLLNDIPETAKIVRTPTLEPANRQRKNLISKLWFRLLRLMCIPDTSILWLPHALHHGLKELEAEKVDLIYVTGNPFSSYLIGLILKKLRKTPLVLDFRDPWTLDPRFGILHNGKPRQLIEKLLERYCIKKADRIVVATEGMLKDFRNAYRDYEEKVLAIPNGFDEDDFKWDGKNNRSDRDEFNIVYTGSFSPFRRPDNFLSGLKLFIERVNNRKIKVFFVGPENDNRAMQMVKSMGLERLVIFTGYVSHEQSTNYLMKADLLLLIIGKSERSKFIMTGKIYEYLASQKPILALCPSEGDAGQLISTLGAGYVVDEQRPDLIGKKIEELYEQFKNGGIKTIRNENLKKHTRRARTAQLSELFNTIVHYS